MRQKTDEKRQQILDVASKLFLKQGLDAVSMSQIASEVGGSKSTLYSYFDNKEELFLAVVLGGIDQMVEQSTASILAPDLPFFEKLRILGVEYLTFILSEDSLALRRIVTAVSNREGTGRQAFHQIIHDSWSHVTALIEQGMANGFLKQSDPWEAATHLKRLFEYDLIDRRLLNIDAETFPDEIKKTVAIGLDVFRSHYEIKHP